MNYNYTSQPGSGGGSTGGGGYDFSGVPQGQQGSNSQQITNSSSTSSASSSFSNGNQFQSPLNGHSTLNTSSGYSQDVNGSSFASSSPVSSVSSSFSRQKYLSSKGFDIEDDLEFCPEILPIHHSPGGGVKFNPYTSMTFSPISPTTDNATTVVSPSSQIASTVKKTPVQDRSLTLSPRIHTPRIKKPLEIINPLTGSKVDSPGIRN